MSDWPSGFITLPGGVIYGVSSYASLLAEAAILTGSINTGGTWPAANRALYMPFIVEVPVTAYQLAVEVTVQSGNCDAGIYNEQGTRLVSAGSTAVAAAGLQTFNITDTALTPGVYFMAMNVDNTTAAFVRSVSLNAPWLQMLGMQQQAVGAVALPDPATFANPASAYVPTMAVALKATI